VSRTEADEVVRVLHRAVPVDRVRLLVHLGDRLAAAAESVDAVPGILADAAAGTPSELVLVWTRRPGSPSGLAAVRHEDPVRLAALTAALGTGRDRTGPADPAQDRFARTARLVAERVMATGRPLVVPDVRASSGVFGTMLAEHLVGTALVVPVWGRAEPVGALALARGPGRPAFGTDDLDFALVLGRRAGMSFETAQLIAQVRRQAALMDAVSDAVIAVDRTGLVTAWNVAAAKLYGIAADDAVGRRLSDLVTVEYEDGDTASATAQVLSAGRWHGRVRMRSVAGAVVDMESSVAATRDRRGVVDGMVAVNRDLTELVASRPASVAAQRFTRDLMEALDSRAAVVDRAGVVVSCNARWTAGASDRDRCACGPVPDGADWLAALHRSTLADVTRFAAEVEEVLCGERPTTRLECRCLDGGAERATAVEVAGLQEAGGAVVVQSDVSWRRRLQDELSHRATHDELTGLPNRAVLVERLGASVDRLGGGQMLAVLFCDLDGFKDINDGLGHAAGDQVLVAVARRLRQRCRSADVVARFGGDEFVVVLPVPDVGRARATAERLVEALSEPITVGDAEVAPGASIGVTVVDRRPPGDDPVGTLLRDADTAMYHAKERGRGRHELFDARLRVDISSRLEYASALRRAVGNDEMALRFQGRRSCGDRRLAGVEALLRWTHPTFGAVSPTVFIPIAERTGGIVEVGGWALQQALAGMSELDDRRLTVSVNVSPRQLCAPRFVEKVDAALASSGLEPWRVVLEITEGALVDDPSQARSLLTDLRRLGVTIALDDFGTGWSSMSFLRTLPVDVIKIDRSFVADLPRDPDACAVVSAVLGLGHGMGLVVVAEGVEREDQLALLRDMGCDEYQGFIDGRPAALRDVLATREPVAR
jgi:diguanylate cyclase (GGDEF)-like protein/PAS domain S-box-containing protein